MYDISEIEIDHKPIVIGEPEWFLMINGTENEQFLNIVHFISTHPVGDH